MNTLVVLSVILAGVVADVSHLESQSPILKSDYQISPEGSFQYEFETGNGIVAQVRGVITKAAGSEYPALEVQGGYSYSAPDGSPVQVSYIANENGYQPSGNVLPTPHPIPELIARSLAYIAEHPSSEIVKSAYKSAVPAYQSLVG